MGTRQRRRQELARLQAKTLAGRLKAVLREGLNCSAFEPAARAAFTGAHGATLASLLLLLGEARTALGRFEDAEPSLLAAHEILSRDEAAEESRRACAESLVNLYVAWHAAEPMGGHDAKAAEWAARGAGSSTE